MANLSDAELSALQQSAGFLPGPNYTYPLTATQLARDEFIQILPFEPYNRDPLRGVTTARPDQAAVIASPAPNLFPVSSNGLPTAGPGANWFTATIGAPGDMALDIETTPYSDFEQFNFRRVGCSFDMDAFQSKVVASGGGGTLGPDVKSTLVRMASMAVVRQLSRDAINSTSFTSSPTAMTIEGLAALYDGTYPDSTAVTHTDTWQVIKSSGTSYALITEVRKLLRRVSPSGGAFGQGPSVLLTSQRGRDLLIATERGSMNSTQPVFLPGPDGQLRYHFDGVPVYVGPVRDDEDATGVLPAFGAADQNHTSFYALRIGGPSGVRMLHVGGESERFGVQVEPVAQAPGSVTEGYRVHGNYALYVPERQSAARLWGVDITSEPW